ncbi:acyltransferase family protein [Georgenia ruanii]|uniref:Acyltransferase family protein n=1 Tax=Georgenia ruanii TaxID=348442 RepID=A0A7J9UW83_9MICO|nr:acyltransferase [Georgenia ruanii]MPV88613.1 acyltransferase family protein [Georgenia ruanii]
MTGERRAPADVGPGAARATLPGPAEAPATPGGAPAAEGLRAPRPPRPPRDRYLDLLRAVALFRVVTYHTFGLSWLSLAFPALGVMFMMAGSLMARSLDRPALSVVRGRVRRLLPPFWFFALCVLPAMVLHGWGPPSSGAASWWGQLLFWVVPVGDLPRNAWGEQLVEPLWYIRAYLWFVLLSPLLLRVFRRYPLPTLALSLAPVVVLTVWQPDGPVAAVAVELATFLTCWLLGFAHRDGVLDAVRGLPMLAVAAALLALGAWWAFTHPDPAAGYDLNEIPLGQALWSAGFVLVLLRFRPTVGWLARVRPLDRAVTVLNSRAVTVYLWHEVALVVGVLVLDVLWNVPAVADHVPLGNQGVLFAVAWVLIVAAIALFGWVEDLAARRRPRLWP